MTTNKKLLAAALTVAMGTSVAHANVDLDGLYVLGGMGAGFLKDAKYDFDDGEVKDDTTFTWRLGVGYMFNDYIGVELNYIHFNESENDYSDDGVDVKTYASAQSIPLLGVVRYPINDFAVFGKVGGSYNIKEAEVKMLGEKASDTQKDWELAYGVGAEYNFTQHVAVQVEYLVTGEDTSAVLGNLAYKF